MAIYGCPGSDQSGTNQCNACKTVLHCGSKRQTANWSNYRYECPGHLRKIGIAILTHRRQGLSYCTKLAADTSLCQFCSHQAVTNQGTSCGATF